MVAANDRFTATMTNDVRWNTGPAPDLLELGSDTSIQVRCSSRSQRALCVVAHLCAQLPCVGTMLHPLSLLLTVSLTDMSTGGARGARLVPDGARERHRAHRLQRDAESP